MSFESELTELLQSIESEDFTGEKRQERLAIIEAWEYNTEMRESFQLVISFKHSLSNLDIDSLSGGSSTTHLSK